MKTACQPKVFGAKGADVYEVTDGKGSFRERGSKKSTVPTGYSGDHDISDLEESDGAGSEFLTAPTASPDNYVPPSRPRPSAPKSAVPTAEDFNDTNAKLAGGSGAEFHPGSNQVSQIDYGPRTQEQQARLLAAQKIQQQQVPPS